MANRREMILAIVVVAFGWVLLMVVLARLQSRGEAGRGPTLAHFPGTESVKEQTVPSLGSRKYWFTLNQPYPSTAVYQFYQNDLLPKGWRRMGPEPRWVHKVEKEQMRDLFQTVWLSADRVYQIDLQMISTVDITRKGEAIATEQRRPGIEVYVTLRRAMGPWLLQPGKTRDLPPGTIDLKETDR